MRARASRASSSSTGPRPKGATGPAGPQGPAGPSFVRGVDRPSLYFSGSKATVVSIDLPPKSNFWVMASANMFQQHGHDTHVTHASCSLVILRANGTRAPLGGQTAHFPPKLDFSDGSAVIQAVVVTDAGRGIQPPRLLKLT